MEQLAMIHDEIIELQIQRKHLSDNWAQKCKPSIAEK